VRREENGTRFAALDEFRNWKGRLKESDMGKSLATGTPLPLIRATAG
jgi:hypothetical protein